MVSHLINGWFSIHFLDEKDAQTIISRTWVRGRSFMQLIPWYLGFNPVLEAPRSKIIWMKLPGLPLEYWTVKALRAIGNSIGTTKYIDPAIIGSSDKKIAWILVEMDFSGGLPGDIDLIRGNRKHRQRIDYWGIPFRCLMCHRTRHLWEHCPFRLRIHRSGDPGGYWWPPAYSTWAPTIFSFSFSVLT